MDNKTKISLFFDLQIITNKDGEPIYMDLIKQYEEGDVSISEDLYSDVFATLLDNNNGNRKYMCPVIEYYSVLDLSIHSLNRQYENEKYNKAVKNNMPKMVSKAVSSLDTLDKHVENISKEIYTVNVEMELDGTGMKSLKCGLFAPNNKECDILEKALYFLYIYYKEGYAEDASKCVNYLLCFSIDNNDINTANIFNIFTGDLNYIYEYKKTEEDEDDPYLEDFSENYIDNFLDILIGGLNKTYYGDFIDKTYRVSKVLN